MLEFELSLDVHRWDHQHLAEAQLNCVRTSHVLQNPSACMRWMMWFSFYSMSHCSSVSLHIVLGGRPLQLQHLHYSYHSESAMKHSGSLAVAACNDSNT